MPPFLNGLLRSFLRLFRPRSELFVFGSSILWGQGHLDSGKIAVKTATWIESHFKERVQVYSYAHSGAFVSGDPEDLKWLPHGEVPTPWPSVGSQIDSAPKPRSGRVRILIEGGINEVGGLRISNPGTSPAYIDSATEDACYRKLSKVLAELSARFPEAEIYVLGYYQILANRTEGKEVREMLDREGMPQPDGGDFAERAIANTRRFRELSDRWMEKAARGIAATHRGRCLFVNSGFTGREGMFGEPSLLFHPWEKDTMMGRRARECTVALGRGQTGLHCYIAATAHPNEAGVARYVSRITAAMERSGRS